MRFVRVAPGTPWLWGRRPFVALLAEAAARLGGRLELEETYGHVGRYRPPGGGGPRPIFGNALGLNAEAAAMLAADKDYTARLLGGAGIAAPEGRLLFSPGYIARMALKNAAVAEGLAGPEAAGEVAAALGTPLVVKPNAGSEGRGVEVVRTAEELAAAVEAGFATDDKLRLERFVPGEDLRVTVLDGAARLAYRRVPPFVVGDGKRSVAALARAELADLAARHRGAKLSLRDPRIARALAAQGVAMADVVARGARVRLLDSANLSAGGRMEDLSTDLPEAVAALAVRAAGLVGLRLAGVDLRGPDPARSAADLQVLEVNAAPGLDYYASAGPAERERALALLEDALR